ncbi:MFS transporter [Lonepinella koalarum]
MNTQTVHPPFGMKDKIGYACGDLANNLTFVIVALFMMKFYTDIMGVSAALVGLLMMAAKVVDAFTDVIMGQIVDRSCYTPKGKFAPWVRRFAGPVVISCVLIFAPYFANQPMWFKIFWMFFTYLLWGSVCYTGANIPYGSMAAAISQEPADRQQLSTWRNIGMVLGQVIVAVILPLIVYQTDDEGRKILNGEYTMIAAIVCGVLAWLAYLGTYYFCTERLVLETKQENRKNLPELFKIIFTNRAFIGIMTASLLLLVIQLTLTGLANYIYPNYFNNTTMLAFSAFIGSAIILFLSAFTDKLVAIFGKKELAVIATTIGAVASFFIYFLHTNNVVVYVILYAISYTGLGVFYLVSWAMMTDVIDDIEIKSEVRSDASVYSVYSFARKLGQAVSSGLIGLFLALAGYNQTTAFDQDVVNKIYDYASLYPALGFVLMGTVLLFIYPLSKQVVKENVRFLALKRLGN